MIHEKMVQDFINKATATWLEEEISTAEKEFSANRDKIVESLLAVISRLCDKAKQLQECNCKGPAAALCISFLRTNIMDNIWKYRLDIYDEKFYLDKVECSDEWEMGFVWDYLKSRLEKLNKAACLGIYANKVKPHHINKVKLTMAFGYHLIAVFYIRLAIEEAINTPEYMNLIKVPGFQIIMGEYIDKNILLYKEQGNTDK